MPRPAESTIIKMGEGCFLFKVLNRPKCKVISSSKITTPRRSTSGALRMVVKPNSVLRPIVSAVAKMSATTHGRTPERNACTTRRISADYSTLPQ